MPKFYEIAAASPVSPSLSRIMPLLCRSIENRPAEVFDRPKPSLGGRCLAKGETDEGYALPSGEGGGAESETGRGSLPLPSRLTPCHLLQRRRLWSANRPAGTSGRPYINFYQGSYTRMTAFTRPMISASLPSMGS